jgi:ATP-dependent exoDNAse (exonuclease V) beta subunit
MNKSQVISVHASAGSGKTYALVGRYLYLLLNDKENIKARNVIAITFTNKAAVEMKRRIINYLKKAALCLDVGDFFNDLNLTRNELAKRSIVILKNVFESYDSFNISTIDSFKNHILKSCAINVGISPNFIIEQDYSDDLLLSLDFFLQKTHTSKNMKNIVSQYLSQYLEKKISWFPRYDIYREIKKVFEKSGGIGKDISYNNKKLFKCEIFSRGRIIINKIKELKLFIKNNQIKKNYLNAIEKALSFGESMFFSMNIPKEFSHDIIKYKKNEKVDNRINLAWKDINTRIESLCDFYIENYFNIYIYIYNMVLLEFDKLNRRNGIIFLSEINKKTIDFFKKNNFIMPEVYYRLSERYKHFLIDEFQDINQIQWLGIKRFLDEILSEGGTFFYVGDIKQAIYSFRGGNSNIFNTAINEFYGYSVYNRYLKQNFRSGKVIVDFNNNVFSIENIKCFLSKVYKKKYSEYNFSKFIKTYSFSKQDTIVEHNYGYVEVYMIDKACKNVEEEIEKKFMEFIFQCLKRFNINDITVLCRTRNEISSVSSWLFKNKIGVESQQALSIKNNECIKQIISLLMFINSPVDTISFSSFILGDIFSKISCIKTSEFEEFIFDCGTQNATWAFYKIFMEKYSGLWSEYFEFFFIKAGFVPVYELVIAILSKFKIIENFPENKIFVMCFLEFIKNFEIRNSGIKDFLEYFNKLNDDDELFCIKNTFGDGIKVMTVHKAKGLQFPVVIMPFLSFLERPLEKPYFDDSNEKIKLLNISENISKFSKKANKIYKKYKEDLLLSEFNVFYVSMTRAEYEFYGIVPPKCGILNNMAQVFFNGKNFSVGDKRIYTSKKKIEENKIIDESVDNYNDIQKYLKSANKSEFDINKVKRNGMIVHYALSKIVSVENGNMEIAINNALEFTRKKFPFDNTEFTRKKIYNLFASREVLNLFMPNNNIIYNEIEIVDKNGESFRIDKLIINDKKVVIIDFKNSIYTQKINEKQIKKYISIVSEIYPEKAIFAYTVDIEMAIMKRCK